MPRSRLWRFLISAGLRFECEHWYLQTLPSEAHVQPRWRVAGLEPPGLAGCVCEWGSSMAQLWLRWFSINIWLGRRGVHTHRGQFRSHGASLGQHFICSFPPQTFRKAAACVRAHSCHLPVIPRMVAHQAAQAVEFSRPGKNTGAACY